MKLRVPVPLWTLLVFCALHKITRATACVGLNECDAGTSTTTTTTTTIVFESQPNCTLSTENNITGNGSITGLTPGAVYKIYFKCLNCCRDVTTKPESVTNVTEFTTSSLFVNWTEPEGNSSFYRVQWTGGETNGSANVNQTFIVITNLTAGVKYKITVTAVADDGQTDGQSVTVFLYTKPEVVRNLKVTNFTTSSVSVNWTEPEGHSSFYRVQWTGGEITGSVNVNDTYKVITNLTAGVQYKISVTAVAGDGHTDGQSETVSQYTKPEVVRNLRVTNFTTSSVSVNWTEPEGHSSFYRVQWTGGEINDSVNVNDTYKAITNLTAGVQYEISVTAVAGDGLTDGQSETVFQYTKPGEIGKPTISTNTSSITLNWTQPPGQVFMYKVEWNHSDATDTTFTNNTSVVLPRLTPGTDYTITITTVAGDNETLGHPQTFTSHTKPDMVRALNVAEVTTSSVFLNWTKPNGNADWYIIQWTTGEEVSKRTINETFILITDLKPGYQYSITVAAAAVELSNVGEETLRTTFTIPTPPGSIIISQRTNSSLLLMWTTPIGMEGAPDVSYNITYQSNSSEIQSKDTTDNSAVLSSLRSGTSYNITVQTVGPGNLGSVVVHESAFTLPNPVLNLVANPNSTTSVKVQWSDPDFQWYYQYSVQTYNTSGVLVNWENVTGNSFEIPNLEPGSRYEINVTTMAADGIESTTEQTFSYTKPEVVRNLKVTNITTSSVYVSWTEPEGNSSFYRVQWTGGETNDPVNVTETYKVITNLTAGVQYKISVTAVAGDGLTDGQSETVSQYTKPEVVRNLSVTNFTTSSVSVNWTEPEGHSSFYRVQWTGGKITGSVNVNDTYKVITNLTAGVQYEISVTAVAGDGHTDGQSVSVSQYTIPEAVTPQVIGGTTWLSVSWTLVSGQVSSYFVLLYRDSQSVENSTHLDNMTANVLFTGLKPGVDYCVGLVTISGPVENPSERVCNATFPNPPGPITVEYQTVNSINFTWPLPDEMEHNQYNFSVSSANGSSLTQNNWFLLDGLQSGSPYSISVVTVGARMYESTAVTAENYTRPYPVTNLTETEITTHSVTLKWDQPESKPDYTYMVQVSDSSGTPFSKVYVNTTVTTISGLLSGTSYSFTVTTQTADGTEAEPVTVSYFTRPYPVTNLTETEITTHSVTLKWDQPESKPDYTYMVQVSNSSGTPFSKVYVNPTVTTIPGLLSGTSYSFTVTTQTADGTEAEPVTVSYSTRPYPVTNLTETEITTNSVTLKWDQPESKPDYTYMVQVSNSSGTHFSKVYVNTTVTTIPGLLSGTNYSFTVTARTADGTEAEPVTVSYFTRPYNITDLVATTLNTTAILLQWMKPLEYRDDYKYWVETTGCASQNETLKGDSTEISELTPGTNCLFCVTVMAANGITGGRVCTSQYTKPETSQPTISSQGSSSSVLVSWSKPPGNVERYQVHLNSTALGFYKSKELNSTSTSFLFEDLLPGRLYGAMLTTYSGNFSASSAFITNATFPKPPGPIEITMKTTASIELKWKEAYLMSNASFFYQLTNTPSQGGGTFTTANTTNTSHTFVFLLSGTSYNISVATVGVLGFESDKVHIYMVTTRPLDVESLNASAEETSVTVYWVKPDEYKESYRYSLSWQSSDGAVSKRTMLNQTKYIIDDLDPGTNYSITVTTETSDGTLGEPRQISICTNASPVKNLACEGPNGTSAEVHLWWDKPDGHNSGFWITVNNGEIPPTYDTCCNHIVHSLHYNTKYTLTVETLSCGRPSTPVSLSCWTGITNPPIPEDYVSLSSVNKKEYNKFLIKINGSLLTDSNGPITHVGVLVTDNAPDEPYDLLQYLDKMYDDWKAGTTQVYLATVTETNSFQSRSSQESLDIVVGDESKWNGYFNGALDANTVYQYAIVLFTSIEMQASDLVDSKSLASTTSFYAPVQLPANPAVVTGIAVGATLGVFCILFIILIGFIIYWKRLSNKESPDIQIHSMRAKVSLAVRVEDYEAYYRKQKADSNCGFAEEFEDLKLIGTAQPKLQALNLENKPKNRYNNVLPYDSSRVKLSIIHGSPYDDYINANYMPGYMSRKEFIAAQGPLPATVNEFWRMIWEKNVQTLVMLTRCNEQGRVKCEQYWSPGTKHFEDITVTTISEIPLEDWTIRDFSIKNVKTAETRSVRHFHFTAWPDHGVPETTELLINFRHLVREHMNQYSRHSPTVVHCSAGVGRTGTFIAIDRLLFQIERDNIVDVFGIVHDLRMHRPLMVQTEDQYVFLNQCALDIIRSRTGNNVDLIYQNAAALSIYENVEPKKNGYRNA